MKRLLMSCLIWIYTVCRLCFEFSFPFSLKIFFFTFADVKFVVCFSDALLVSHNKLKGALEHLPTAEMSADLDPNCPSALSDQSFLFAITIYAHLEIYKANMENSD